VFQSDDEERVILSLTYRRRLKKCRLLPQTPSHQETPGTEPEEEPAAQSPAAYRQPGARETKLVEQEDIEVLVTGETEERITRG